MPRGDYPAGGGNSRCLLNSARGPLPYLPAVTAFGTMYLYQRATILLWPICETEFSNVLDIGGK
jgi:hypothetical protein